VSDLRSEVEARLGYEFRDRALLEAALTHRSHAHEAGQDQHYERLEFLGDAVLGMVAADWLFHARPGEPEGELSRLKASAVSERALARYAEVIGLGAWIRLGVGEDRSGGRRKSSLLADPLEALFGAIYLDGGLEAARRAIERFLEENPTLTEDARRIDAKSALQELVQGRGWPLPSYEVVAAIGPGHATHFTVDVRLRGELAGRGEGRSKKEAQQQAAAAALERLLAESEPPAEP
jgi:ribonuclease III